MVPLLGSTIAGMMKNFKALNKIKDLDTWKKICKLLNTTHSHSGISGGKNTLGPKIKEERIDVIYQLRPLRNVIGIV